MNKEQLHTYICESTGNESNICQIYVIKDGKTVYDDNWHGFRTEDAMNVNSVTKGIMALLAGIAIDRGDIENVDQKVLDFFPGYTVKRGEKTIYDVTVRHLLTMTAPYKYKSEPWTKVCTSEDWTLAVLDYLGGRKGITGEFKYATLGIQILAGVIENATGKKCIDLANENLFGPLGLPARILHGDSSKEDQFDFFMNKNPRKYEWYSDPQDTVTAGWGLCMSAKDMAVIGEMVLNDGKFNGQTVISEKYINEMLTPYQKLGERMGFMNYGYLWYKPLDDREIYAAIGDCGNIIYVDKEKNVSVGMTGTFKPRIFDRVEFIDRILLPAVISGRRQIYLHTFFHRIP
jgi:CubicO group peptidase (beta-lactamase class C family)